MTDGRPPRPNLPPSLSSAWFPRGQWAKLYKYTRQAHAEALVLRGEVRLGTLFGYRKVERFSPMIADPGEGITALTETIELPTMGPQLSDFAALTLPRYPGLHVENVGINLRIGAGNVWLFCTSARLSKQVMKSMDPTYDACVQIDHPDLFRRIIANELIRQNRIRGHNRAGTVPCVYRVKSRHYTQDDGISPIALKAPDYLDQEEVRMVFIPREPIPKAEEDGPLDLVCPALARCCRIVEHVPTGT